MFLYCQIIKLYCLIYWRVSIFNTILLNVREERIIQENKVIEGQTIVPIIVENTDARGRYVNLCQIPNTQQELQIKTL